MINPYGKVLAVSASPTHSFQKQALSAIRLLAGLGVEGDAHCGTTVQHRSRVAQDPSKPNLRQVHLIHFELLEELRLGGFDLFPGQMGENITTLGLDLLALPRHAILHIGEKARVQVTGLRNPCNQLNGLQPGLMQAVLDRDGAGNLVRKAGIMGIVLEGGFVRPDDPIRIELPAAPYLPLERV